MPGFALLEDFVWHRARRIWLLHCRITASVRSGSSVPETTDWFLHIEDTYPTGDVIFYPAKSGGITETFNHQNHNSAGSDELPWRSGRLCVDTSLRTLGRRAYDNVEPFDPDSRLVWHVKRVQEWLGLASRGELVQPEDPFELPYIPSLPDSRVIFAEGPENLPYWQGQHPRSGTAKIRILQENPRIFVVDEFSAGRSRIDIKPTWTKPLGKATNSRAAWIWLDRLPVLDPWAIPTLWGEFRESSCEQGINLDPLLRSAVKNLRDGREHLLLVGFPIPDKVQGPAIQVHWLALLLPPLTSTRVNGFRTSEPGYWKRDRQQLFGDEATIRWIETENWHQDEISGRGRLEQSIRSKSVLIIGGGAMGSALGEILIRSGIQRLTIIDHDCLQAGNLVRHTLGVSHIGEPKSPSLADRLNDAAVHAVVSSIDTSFPPRKQEGIDMVLDADVVIDCSADDKVAEHLKRFPWERPVTFVSVSVGLKFRRLFTYIAHGDTFPADDFNGKLAPWLRSEIGGYNGEFPRDGTGCWHALMPGRIDDTWMMTGAAAKTIESAIADPPREPALIVFEQEYEKGTFVGLRRVSEPHSIF